MLLQLTVRMAVVQVAAAPAIPDACTGCAPDDTYTDAVARALRPSARSLQPCSSGANEDTLSCSDSLLPHACLLPCSKFDTMFKKGVKASSTVGFPLKGCVAGEWGGRGLRTQGQL